MHSTLVQPILRVKHGVESKVSVGYRAPSDPPETPPTAAVELAPRRGGTTPMRLRTRFCAFSAAIAVTIPLATAPALAETLDSDSTTSPQAEADEGDDGEVRDGEKPARNLPPRTPRQQVPPTASSRSRRRTTPGPATVTSIASPGLSLTCSAGTTRTAAITQTTTITQTTATATARAARPIRRHPRPASPQPPPRMTPSRRRAPSRPRTRSPPRQRPRNRRRRKSPSRRRQRTPSRPPPQTPRPT